MATRNRVKGQKKSLLDLLDLTNPIAIQAIQESNQKIADHRRMLRQKRQKREEEERKLEEERQNTLVVRAKLAEENERLRNIEKEKMRKASEAALEALVQKRKRTRRN